MFAISMSQPSWSGIQEATANLGVYIDDSSLYAALYGIYGSMALKHIHLACMSDTEHGLKIVQRTGLRCSGQGTLWVFSGTLDDWRASSIEFCSRDTNADVRRMFNRIVLFFDTQRVFAFKDFNRVLYGDTFILERKKI